MAPVPCASAAEREIHAGADILRRPVRFPVGADVVESAHEGPVRVLAARPDVALVEMGVNVDEARQHDPAVEIEARQIAVEARGAGRHNGGDASVLDADIDEREVLRVAGEPRTRHERERRAPRREAIGGFLRDRSETLHHRSRPSALSCQWRSKRWERADITRKIMTPAAASSPSAAKRRGMLSRYWLSTMR